MKEVRFDPIAHEYFLGDRKFISITQLLKHFGMTPDYEAFGNDNSRDFGSHVHAACALRDQDNLGEYDKAMEPWLLGYRKFIEVHNPQWTAIEKPFISTVWGFAGTPDRFGQIGNRTAIVELKTGSPDPSHDLQTAGQQILVEEYYSTRVQDRYTLYLKPDDFKLVKHPGKTDKTVFLSLASAYQWKLAHKLTDR
jgi:CRISPR/Cas system-associated exonuclease Cas4 (RecB family)